VRRLPEKRKKWQIKQEGEGGKAVLLKVTGTHHGKGGQEKENFFTSAYFPYGNADAGEKKRKRKGTGA